MTHRLFFRKGGRTMRLDKYLKVSRLIKRRTVANEACDAERVTVNGTCEKFIRRFRAMEEAAAAAGRSLSDMTLEEMTALWNRAKECS